MELFTPSVIYLIITEFSSVTSYHENSQRYKGNILKTKCLFDSFSFEIWTSVAFFSKSPGQQHILKWLRAWIKQVVLCGSFQDCTSCCRRRLRHRSLRHQAEWRLFNPQPGLTKMLQAVSVHRHLPLQSTKSSPLSLITRFHMRFITNNKFTGLFVMWRLFQFIKYIII